MVLIVNGINTEGLLSYNFNYLVKTENKVSKDRINCFIFYFSIIDFLFLALFEID